MAHHKSSQSSNVFLSLLSEALQMILEFVSHWTVILQGGAFKQDTLTISFGGVKLHRENEFERKYYKLNNR